RSTGVIALTAAANPVREGNEDHVGLRQTVASPAKNLAHDLPLARTTHAGREQEVDAQDLCCQANYLLPCFADLIFEFHHEGSIALVGRGDERFVDAVQDIRTPDGSIFEQQRSIAKETVGTESLGCLIDP